MIVLAPRSTIIPSPELIVDYKTYMGSPGILFVIASGILYGALCIAELLTVTKIWIPSYISIMSVILTCIPLTQMRNTVWSSGIEFWTNIIINAPGKARAYNNYGVELAQKLSRFEEAIPYYQKAIAMDHYYSDPWNNLAVSYAALHKINDAIHATRQGLSIYPYYPEGYNNLASFYLQEKKYDEAKEALRIALSLRPHYGKALYNLGRLYLDQGNQEQAWLHFKQCCCNGDLDNEVGFEAYAQMSILCKKYDDAHYAYQKLLSLQPTNKEYYFGLASVYQYKNLYQDAEKIYRKLIEAAPYEGRFWYNLGECLFSRKEYQEALPIFQKIIQSGKCPAQAMVRLAGCHEGLGRNNTAYQILEELKKTLSADEKKLVEEAQERMCLAYGKSIKEQ